MKRTRGKSRQERSPSAKRFLNIVICSFFEKKPTNLCSRLRQPEQAIEYYERAIALQPDYAQAHFNLGMTLLQLGDYRRGFAEYEWRWQTGQFTPFQCPHPKWDGRPIPDKTLLIHTEQGAGDAIQFARFLPLAAQRCQKLMLVCRADLIPVFAAMPGIAEIREAGQIHVSEFDTYAPLLSLPHVLDTTLETLPAGVPYIDVAAIRRRKDSSALPLLEPSAQPKVGIVWAGSPTYRHDRQRSCALQELLPVLRTAGVDFLQRPERRAQSGAGAVTAGGAGAGSRLLPARLRGSGRHT